MTEYPTLYFYKDKKIENFIIYKGEHEMKNLIEFLNDNLDKNDKNELWFNFKL